MNGPEHYREAEKALEFAWSGESSDPELGVASAQVHATLALAAATSNAAALASHGYPEWGEVTR